MLAHRDGHGSSDSLRPRAPDPRTRTIDHPSTQTVAPWHFLYFLPLPHGQGALRGTFSLTA
jgi:hypothetical protein